MEQDDQEDIDDQEDEQDVIYTEDDSNNNPDGDNLEDTGRNGDNNTHSMPNENLNDATNLTHDVQNQDNHTSGGHHMKNSPSDEEFYGGPSTGELHFFLFFCCVCLFVLLKMSFIYSK